MRISIAPLALFLNGCMHVLVGVHPLVNVTAKSPEQDCTQVFQDSNDDGLCDEQDFYLMIEDPVGERWVPIQDVVGQEKKQHIRVDFFADYQLIRDEPVDCLGQPMEDQVLTEGDMIRTSYIVMPIAFSDPVIVNDIKWSSRLNDGNPDTQNVQHTVLDNGTLCLTVSSVYFDNIDAANLGVP